MKTKIKLKKKESINDNNIVFYTDFERESFKLYVESIFVNFADDIGYYIETPLKGVHITRIEKNIIMLKKGDYNVSVTVVNSPNFNDLRIPIKNT